MLLLVSNNIQADIFTCQLIGIIGTHNRYIGDDYFQKNTINIVRYLPPPHGICTSYFCLADNFIYELQSIYVKQYRCLVNRMIHLFLSTFCRTKRFPQQVCARTETCLSLSCRFLDNNYPLRKKFGKIAANRTHIE